MKTIRRYFDIILSVALLMATLWLICSCSTVKYVPVETLKTDSVRVVDIQRDSVYIADTTIIREKADTVYITRWRTEYKEALRVDTVRVVRTDSIQTIVEVERELSKMEELKMNIGSGVLWAIPILIALYILYRKFLK